MPAIRKFHLAPGGARGRWVHLFADDDWVAPGSMKHYLKARCNRLKSERLLPSYHCRYIRKTNRSVLLGTRTLRDRKLLDRIAASAAWRLLRIVGARRTNGSADIAPRRDLLRLGARSGSRFTIRFGMTPTRWLFRKAAN
jgi:hypothetical protein